MTLKNFIKQNRQEIDDFIRKARFNGKIDDEERRLWVLNNERLYNWAKSEVKNLD